VIAEAFARPGVRRLLVGLLVLVVVSLPSPSALEPASAQAPEFRWVLVEVIPNARNAAVESSLEQGYHTGTTYRYFHTESTLGWDYHAVVDGTFVGDWSFLAEFEAPPSVLEPGERVSLSASVSVPVAASVEYWEEVGGIEPTFGITFSYSVRRSQNLVSGPPTLLDESRHLRAIPAEGTFEDSFVYEFTAPERRNPINFNVVAAFSNHAVAWIYERQDVDVATAVPTPAATTSPTATAGPGTGDAGNGVAAESPAEQMDRRIAQNLNDYLRQRQAIDGQLQSLYRQADLTLEELRLWQWDLLNGTAEDKEQAALEIARLQEVMADLLDEFEALAGPLDELLEAIDGQFITEPQHPDLLVTLDGFRSELDLLRLNLVLRSGNVEEFDRLFNGYAADDNIAPQVLVANAFRQLMDGDVRIALESVRRALERDPTNATALQLRRDLERTYLGRIRDQLAKEIGENARLFNEKLNSHGDAGVGQIIIDIFTTAPAESVLAVSGYYDLLEQISGLNIDEATEQIAGIRLLEDLLQSGFALEDLNALSVDRMGEIALQHYNREITEEQARSLRDRIFDAFKNVDVDAIRNGDRTQFNVDIGREYFDTDVLESGAGDVVLRQFSAWDTFLTFAPSAQLGRVANTGVAARLGLTSTNTLQQGLQRGLRIQELGARIYQTSAGAAAVDAMYAWRGFETMLADAVKARIGDVAYAAGSAAVTTAINELSAPARKALNEELLAIGDYYLGAQTVGNIEATAQTLSAIFGFVGANAEELQRGAYGAESAANQRAFVDAEAALDEVTLNSQGVAAARGVDQLSLDDFEAQLASGGNDYLDSLGSARDSLGASATDPNIHRRVLAGRATQTIDGMQQTAEALASGDREAAQRIWEQTQGIATTFEQSVADQAARLSEFQTLSKQLGLLATSTPTDRGFAGTVAGKLTGAAPQGTATFVNALSAAGLETVPQESGDFRLRGGE